MMDDCGKRVLVSSLAFFFKFSLWLCFWLAGRLDKGACLAVVVVVAGGLGKSARCSGWMNYEMI